MIVSYDGTSYNGFQSQPNRNTVQDKLEEAIWHLTGETVKVLASGRTDAGVHARGQVFNFLTESQIPVERWCVAMNTRLPQDIAVYAARELPLDFHSRRSAKKKTYKYRIRIGRHRDVFQYRTEYHHYKRLNLEEMRKALKHLEGEHDFTSFCSVRSDKPSHVRTIYEAKLEFTPDVFPFSDDSGMIEISITGNGFLYNMVRIIVGTLLQVGEGRRKSSDFPAILKAMDRSKAGPTAEPHGLILWEVEYAEFQKSP